MEAGKESAFASQSSSPAEISLVSKATTLFEPLRPDFGCRKV